MMGGKNKSDSVEGMGKGKQDSGGGLGKVVEDFSGSLKREMSETEGELMAEEMEARFYSLLGAVLKPGSRSGTLIGLNVYMVPIEIDTPT